MTYYRVNEVSILDLFRNGHDTLHIAHMRHMKESEVLRLLTLQRTRDLNRKRPHYRTSWEVA